MEQSYSLTVVDRDERDITTEISDICKKKFKNDLVISKLNAFHEIRISKGSEVTRYKLSTPPFFAFGGLGIVFGLDDFTDGEPSKSGLAMQYVIKVDCSKFQGKILHTAIAINEEFGQYGEQYKDNMALAYGNIESTSSPIGSFAIYKYLGFELREILFGSEKRKLADWTIIRRIIFNVISCMQRFNTNLFLHGDVSIENFVYNPTTYEVDLIDFDSMTHLTEISISPTCMLTLKEDGIQVCSKTEPSKCFHYDTYWGRFLIPEVYMLLDMMDKIPQGGAPDVQEEVDSKSIVTKLMRADKFGLFWVIIKILIAANGLYEDDIDNLFSISIGTSTHNEMKRQLESYERFYANISSDKTEETDDVVRIIHENTLVDDDDFLESFIRETLKLIQVGSQDDSELNMSKLLNHPFLQPREPRPFDPTKHAIELIEKLNRKIKLVSDEPTKDNYDSIWLNEYVRLQKLRTKYREIFREPGLLSIYKKLALDLKQVNEFYTSSQLSKKTEEEKKAQATDGGGSYNKKHRSSRVNRNTKQRNNRNKQNRTKKAKSKRAQK